jgi:hypothetical protein
MALYVRPGLLDHDSGHVHQRRAADFYVRRIIRVLLQSPLQRSAFRRGGPERNPRGVNLTLAGPVGDSMDAYDDPPDGIGSAIRHSASRSRQM